MRPGTYKVVLRCLGGERQERSCNNNCLCCMWKTVEWEEKVMSREELQRYLIRCCYWYYVECNPLISDQRYDELHHQLEALEASEGVTPSDSPTQMIYGDRAAQYPDWVKERQ